MSGIPIKDGASGLTARVTAERQLTVQSESLPLPHYISRTFGQDYKLQASATPTNGTTTVLHITNDSNELRLVINEIQLQAVALSGGTALPNASNYWQFSFETDYDSGGNSVTPINTNTGAGNSADVTAYDGDPTLTGTPLALPRYYPLDATAFRAEGDSDIIIAPGDSISVQFIGDHTSGVLVAVMDFMMMDLGQ